MKVEKIKSKQCLKCKSENVWKEKDGNACYDCNAVFDKNGKKVNDIDKRISKGYDPKIDTNDYIEGSEGVWEMS